MTSNDSFARFIAASDAVLGYLNFSSGARDPQLFRALDDLYRSRPPDIRSETSVWLGDAQTGQICPCAYIIGMLNGRLQQLHEEQDTFAECRQAEQVLAAVQKLIPEYFDFHRDLLFHQHWEDIFNPFMLGVSLEALIQQQPPWDDLSAPVESAIRQLNDFVGYRPIPVLESHRVEPRSHERVRPVPLYLADIGVAMGKYADLIAGALQILRETDSDLCEAAGFSLDRLKELAFDPRAYDFDHPVNRRPNYHFGEWDPHAIDSRGHYHRFVVREVTLQALLARVANAERLRLPVEELLWEASAVLAGTMLMASAITGDHPAAHDSVATLARLIPKIAVCRDQFYERSLAALATPHADRLRREAHQLRQPLGGARQHLNAHLARQRAEQLERVRLARVFARMGYMNAAQRQSDVVHVASARIICRIDCRLTACYHAIRRGDQSEVLDHLDHVIDLMHRGIECGALVDPWNILGFEANFSIFPAVENSVYDHRVDDLLRLVHRTMDVMARLWSDAAAKPDATICEGVAARFEEFTKWWHQYAIHEVSAVDFTPPLDEWEAAKHVSAALGEWQRHGAAAGDLKFWTPHVNHFTTAKPYVLVVETLLTRDDLISAMSLLVHWLSELSRVPLESRGASFYDVVILWAQRLCDRILATAEEGPPDAAADPRIRQPWNLLCKFFDYLEANADPLWEVPRFSLGNHSSNRGGQTDRKGEAASPHLDEDDEATSDGLFDAAYENVVYRDSTDDGMDSTLFERTSTVEEDDWEREVQRCHHHLMFIYTLGRLWRMAAVTLARASQQTQFDADRTFLQETLAGWHDRSRMNRVALLEFMDHVADTVIQRDGNDVESMARYDRQRLRKEALLEQAIMACSKMAAAELALMAACHVVGGLDPAPGIADTTGDNVPEEWYLAAGILAAALRSDRQTALRTSDDLIDVLPAKEILYAPLARGGTARRIAEVRIRQQYLQDILIALPRLGLIRQALELLETVREMERNVPPGRGAVTQFDDIFETGFQELVELLVRSTDNRRAWQQADDQDADTALIGFLEQLAEQALSSWLQHSQTLRLSVLERVRSPAQWRRLVAFVEKFGDEIFTQEFLHLGNIRAILHFGTENWLRELAEDEYRDTSVRLLDELDRTIPLPEAAQWLAMILEAVSENYDEYRDYNSTTTQSDAGHNLHILLDFLRLRSEYDRVAWNLRPVILAHRVLVRNHRSEAAQLWRRLLHERLGTEADSYGQKLARLQKKHAVTLGTVAQRIDERFLQPMTIDRMQSLVAPAIAQSRSGAPCHAFEILAEEAEILMRDSLGAGINVPKWLAALEEEIERLDSGPVSGTPNSQDDVLDLDGCVLSLDELQEELADHDEA